MLTIKPSNHRCRARRAVCVAIGAWLLTAPAWAEGASSATAASIASSDLPSAQKSLAILDARERLESYRRSAFDRGTIARNFDRIVGWAREHRMPPDRIILGEFGARKQDGPLGQARNAERAQWLRDVREEAEARGFIWAAWVYRDTGGFSLLDENGTELDPLVIEALGLDRP
jgi:endoglucanase